MSVTTNEHSGRMSRLRAALHEVPALGWTFAYFFCLLCAYYVLRPVREAMGAASDVNAVFPPAMIDFFAGIGMPLDKYILQILFTCTFLIMLLLQPIYGWLVSRYPRRVFLPTVYTFFIGTLLGFYLMFDSGIAGRGMAFFLWLTVFNLFAVAVFWSFMADIYTNVQAKAYYGYVGAAGTIGAFLGPVITRSLVERVGIANLMLVSAVLLSVCVLCIFKLRPYAVAREQRQQLVSGETPMGGDVWAGLKLIAKEPLLRWMAVLMVLAVGVGTLLYNEQAAIVRVYYPDARAATAFYSTIDLAVNTLTLIVQLLITRALLSRYGIAPALLLPAFAIILGFSILAASPLPMIVAVVQVMTRSCEFSLGKPARETIYTRVGREWRYKSGAAIDTVVYRGGDLTFVWLHKAVAAFGSSAVFGLGVLVASGMSFAAWRLLSEDKKLVPERATD